VICVGLCWCTCVSSKSLFLSLFFYVSFFCYVSFSRSPFVSLFSHIQVSFGTPVSHLPLPWRWRQLPLQRSFHQSRSVFMSLFTRTGLFWYICVSFTLAVTLHATATCSSLSVNNKGLFLRVPFTYIGLFWCTCVSFAVAMTLEATAACKSLSRSKVLFSRSLF